ncbi:MAG: 4-hydroxy-3-methylbut-2-enyl diphosphate reductase [Flavobacteriales bacterium]|nr:4-hydroxy-3-methylbut-2-enyl diphosphate reductase [Flavobacteriales bacterium]
MKKFNIPYQYRSTIIGKIKEYRQNLDPKKKDFSPTTLDFGSVKFHIARHFGFCFGVENAIEISYKALDENPGKRIFLLSQMIHNPDVNNNLLSKGIRFIMDTSGKQLIPWEEIHSDDIIVIPAFGTTLEILDLLKKKGLETKKYDTTCPFVTRVWKRSDQLGKQNYSIIIHGKYNHEETRATFSYSKQNAPALIIKDMDEAVVLSEFILGKRPLNEFKITFEGKYSEDFDPSKHLENIGVINQTTMLASETQGISTFLKGVMEKKYGVENSKIHMANTRDTLCYATNENQDATYELLTTQADLAIVIGGYNSSNTSHLVELCEEKLPTYFIKNASEIAASGNITHFDYNTSTLHNSENFLPQKDVVNILVTSGASCPDTTVEGVLEKLLSFFPHSKATEKVLDEL